MLVKARKLLHVNISQVAPAAPAGASIIHADL
jgi:hypothetical protein